MVHALETVHSLLKPGGILIDIHPNGDPPPIEVHAAGQVKVAGHLEETDDFVEYFEADQALLAASERGLFELERQGLFTFKLHAPTISDLADHLEAEWSDSVLRQETKDRAKRLMSEPGDDKEIILRETVHIARFRAGHGMA